MVKKIIIGNRIPKEFFVTSGIGESNITTHAGSFHLALRDAGIERYNIMHYSSILPSISVEIEKPKEQIHGAVMDTIMACANYEMGQVTTAGIMYGSLYHKKNGKKEGGIVCEYNGNCGEEKAIRSLESSLEEIYTSGFSELCDLKEIKKLVRSFVPTKKYGTALVTLCFTSYEIPILYRDL